MRSKFWMVLAGLMVVTAPLAAQERDDEATIEEQEQVQDDERAEPAFRLKVLDDPYDISSFYRSSGGYGRGGGFLMGDGYERRGGNAYRDPYAIAGYYRGESRGGYSYGPGRGNYGYSQFWVSGYSGRSRGLRYRRHIGENGDLFFFAPAILAPVGPLSEVFLSGR
jgi:hypothetical protein